MQFINTLCLAIALFLSGFAIADPQRFSSGEQQTRLVELYTSEGCSSCPAADLWLTQFKTRPDLWTVYVPVAFHVDYWNYLGWEDRFSRKAHTRRQARYKRQGGVNSVYTPGFVINGYEWRGFFSGNASLSAGENAVGEDAGGGEKVGVLSLQVDGPEFTAQFADPSGQHHNRPSELTIALLGMDLETPVKAGENRNRQLAHDFVLLDQQTYNSDSGSWEGTIEFYLDEPAPRYALVAWVSAPDAQAPVQALGGWFSPENRGASE